MFTDAPPRTSSELVLSEATTFLPLNVTLAVFEKLCHQSTLTNVCHGMPEITVLFSILTPSPPVIAPKL